MVNPFQYLSEGSRILWISWKNKLREKRYPGSAEEICQQIIRDCWNGRFFQTSTDNFPQFWTRDFGFCVQSLMKLGYKNEVHHTLRYALNHFKEQGKITTTITPQGKPYDFPTFAADSLPWLIHAIRAAKFPLGAYKFFLAKELEKYFEKVIVPSTGLVRPDLHISSIKDFARRKSSCYDNCMVGLLAKDLAQLELRNHLAAYNYADLIKRHLWNGKYFYDDLRKGQYVAGDANVFPFLFSFGSKEMLKSAGSEMQAAGLDKPFPLKYTSSRKGVDFIWQEKLGMSDYESDAIWTHLGLLYVKVLAAVDEGKAKEYKEKYKILIEKQGNFLEVYAADGKPYATWFYQSSPGMLWAANYLKL